MRKATAFVLATLLTTLIASQLSFDLTDAGYQVVAGYWALTVPVTGGVAPLTYNYQSLPPAWIQTQNVLDIPLAVTALGGSFPIKTIVTDSLGNQLKQTLLIKITGGSIFLGSYPYNATFANSSVILSSGSSSSSSSSSISSYTLPPTQTSSSSSVSNVNTFGTSTSSAGVIPLSRQQGNNNPLPTSDQLDQLINSGDILSITQTIQNVIASSLSCNQKVGYLNDFLGRIKSYIQIKGSQANQLQSIITNAQNLINSLNAQISNYTISSNRLNITYLQNQLTDLTSNLQTAYDQYNSANVDLTPYNLNISANLQSINTLSAQINSTTTQLNNDNQSLSDTENLIASLQEQLTTAQQNKNAL